MMPKGIESRLNQWGAALFFVVLAMIIFVDPAHAANGEEFKDLYAMVHDWSQGYLGKTLSITFLLVGLGMGVVRGSVMAAVAAIAAGVALLMLPNIIDAMFGVV